MAQPITAREGKGPNSDCDSGNIVLDNHGAYPLASALDTKPYADHESKESQLVLAPALAFRGGAQQDEFVDAGGIVGALAHSSNTHGGNHQPKTMMGTIPRRLTPTECERLQGFPDNWTQVAHNGKPMADGPRYRMMGNAVTVNVVEWIARKIVLAESATEAVS